MLEAAAQFFSKGAGPVGAVAGRPRTSATGARISHFLGRGVASRQRQCGAGTGDAFARARQLWEQLRSPSEFLRIPYGQSFYHVFRGELDLALRFDEDLLRLSRQRNDFAGLVLGHSTLVFDGGLRRSGQPRQRRPEMIQPP
jgi:hypothetical protein